MPDIPDIYTGQSVRTSPDTWTGQSADTPARPGEPTHAAGLAYARGRVPNPTQPNPTGWVDPSLSGQGAQEPPGPPAQPPVFDACMNTEETIIPLNLRERASEPGGAVDQLAAHLKQPRAVILAALEEYVGHWTIGGGQGEKRSRWLAHFRKETLRAARNGLLKPIGRVEHEANAEARPPRRIKTIAELEQEALNARP